jgi:hypothetical protein
MNLAVVEQEIADWLSQQINDPEIGVEVVPEHDDGLDFPFGTHGQIIVAAAAEEAEADSRSIDVGNQDSSVLFSCLIRSKALRSGKGIYYLLNLVKRHLVGFVPSGGDALRFTAFKFEKKENAVFEYVADFKTRAKVMQVHYQEPIEEGYGADFKGLI